MTRHRALKRSGHLVFVSSTVLRKEKGMSENFCESCGQYTTRRVFGALLCAPCHEAEDRDVEDVERRDAERFGYRYGWKDES